MRVLWAVVKREYLERVRTRWFAVATLFGPVLFAALMFLPAYMGQRTKASDDVSRIRILDATGTNLGELVAFDLGGGITGDPSATRVVRVTEAGLAAAESTATADVAARRLKGYLVFPSRLLVEGGARYAGVNATALADMDFLRGVVQRRVLAAQLQAEGVSEASAEPLPAASV